MPLGRGAAQVRVCSAETSTGRFCSDDMDYLLGVYDMTGELMRYAITAMAIGGVNDEAGPAPGACSWTSRSWQAAPSTDSGWSDDHHMQKQVRGKVEVMLQSIAKGWSKGAVMGLSCAGSEMRPSDLLVAEDDGR